MRYYRFKSNLKRFENQFHIFCPRKSLIQDLSPKTEEPASWKEVVQRRIESNTRRFAKGERQPPPVVQLSRFAPVAGHFFYPLLVKVDQREPCLDLIGQDSAILCRLLYTLSIVVHCATNAPVCCGFIHFQF